MRRFAICAGLSAAVFGCWAERSLPRVLEYPSAGIREEQTVQVNGSEEVWRLVWKTPPEPECEPSGVSLTCPCTGFAFGETGDLELIRLRAGFEKDRLNLTGLYKDADVGSGRAVVQRWAVRDADYAASLDFATFAKAVAARPSVQVMHIADYDHDGEAEEFFLHTDTEPCGKQFGVVVGVTRANPRLHVFGTAAHPERPLVVTAESWKALKDAAGPVEAVEWPCGDHGSEEQTEVRLSWTAKGIEATRHTFGCVDEIRRGRLISRETL